MASFSLKAVILRATGTLSVYFLLPPFDCFLVYSVTVFTLAVIKNSFATLGFTGLGFVGGTYAGFAALMSFAVILIGTVLLFFLSILTF